MQDKILTCMVTESENMLLNLIIYQINKSTITKANLKREVKRTCPLIYKFQHHDSSFIAHSLLLTPT